MTREAQAINAVAPDILRVIHERGKLATGELSDEVVRSKWSERDDPHRHDSSTFRTAVWIMAGQGVLNIDNDFNVSLGANEWEPLT